MKKIAIVTMLVLACGPASAISHYYPHAMTCAQVQSAIKAEGAVILRYRSPRNPNLTLYDRYVAQENFCSATERPNVASVPTRDTDRCVVINCRPSNFAGGGAFLTIS